MHSLAHLNFKDNLESIANDHPSLIYYICYLKDRENFPIQPFIDIEQDCRKLAKFDITEFKHRSNRHTHSITPESCSLTKIGEAIANELLQEKICEALLNMIVSIKKHKRASHITREDFSLRFFDSFTFEKLTEDILYNKFCEIKSKYKVHLPSKNYKHEKSGNSMIFNNEIIDDIFNFVLKFKCSCSNTFEYFIKINETHFENNEPYMVKCKKCDKIFYVTYNFFYFTLIN